MFKFQNFNNFYQVVNFDTSGNEFLSFEYMPHCTVLYWDNNDFNDWCLTLLEGGLN